MAPQKSLMLAPICNGDRIAAALLDYLYPYFQHSNNPYERFFHEIYSRNREEISLDFYQSTLQENYEPFCLDYENYPDKWFTRTLEELRSMVFLHDSIVSSQEMIEALKILEDKQYLSLEDWEGIVENYPDGREEEEYFGEHSPSFTFWIFCHRVDYAADTHYHTGSIPLPLDERIDVRREKRIIRNHIHRARRIGQAASLTLEEWIETLTHFQMHCAFCLKAPYEVLEHVIPIIHGGSSSSFNCVPACEWCNAAKGDQLLLDIQDMDTAQLQTIQEYLEQRRRQWMEKKRRHQ